jgi:hypothetical protein
MAHMSVPMVLPLHPDDEPHVRKARVAELHDLWLRAGCSQRVMILLLDHRHGRRLGEIPVPPPPDPVLCNSCAWSRHVRCTGCECPSARHT